MSCAYELCIALALGETKARWANKSESDFQHVSKAFRVGGLLASSSLQMKIDIACLEREEVLDVSSYIFYLEDFSRLSRKAPDEFDAAPDDAAAQCVDELEKIGRDLIEKILPSEPAKDLESLFNMNACNCIIHLLVTLLNAPPRFFMDEGSNEFSPWYAELVLSISKHCHSLEEAKDAGSEDIVKDLLGTAKELIYQFGINMISRNCNTHTNDNPLVELSRLYTAVKPTCFMKFVVDWYVESKSTSNSLLLVNSSLGNEFEAVAVLRYLALETNTESKWEHICHIRIDEEKRHMDALELHKITRDDIIERVFAVPIIQWSEELADWRFQNVVKFMRDKTVIEDNSTLRLHSVMSAFKYLGQQRGNTLETLEIKP